MIVDLETAFRADHDPHEHYDKLYSCIRRDRRLDLKSKYVYTYIAGLARKSRTCFATNATLAQELDISASSIKSALSILAKHGIITVSFQSSAYGTRRIIRLPRLSEVYPSDSAWETEAGSPQPAFDSPRTDADRPRGDVDRPRTDADPIRYVVRDGVQDVERNDRTDTPLPPGTGDGGVGVGVGVASSSILQPPRPHASSAPISAEAAQSAWEAFCAAADYDVTVATTRERRRSLQSARRLLAEGVTVEEIVACTLCLTGQDWRRHPITMATVENEIGTWRMAGKPPSAASPGEQQYSTGGEAPAAATEPSPLAANWLPNDWTWHLLNRQGMPHEWLRDRTAAFRQQWQAQAESGAGNADWNGAWQSQLEREWEEEQRAGTQPEPEAALQRRDLPWDADSEAWDGLHPLWDDPNQEAGGWDDDPQEPRPPREPFSLHEEDSWLPRPVTVSVSGALYTN